MIYFATELTLLYGNVLSFIIVYSSFLALLLWVFLLSSPAASRLTQECCFFRIRLQSIQRGGLSAGKRLRWLDGWALCV